MKNNDCFHERNININNSIFLRKGIIFIFFVFLFVYDKQSLKAIINIKNIIYKRAFINIKNSDIIEYSNNSIKVSKKNETINDIKNNLIDGKLYWNNQTSLNIKKIKDEIKQYYKFQISFDNNIFFKKRKNPKISLVITLCNQFIYIKRIYSSILKQEMKDIEIIFVDDASTDNTSILIKELMKKDKRIVYLKNSRKKRAFYSRNKGILFSKGEYILVIDPDDLLINNILIKAYETGIKYNLDIVQFYALIGYIESPILWIKLKNKSGILLNNTEIRNNFYHCLSRNLWDKLVRKNIYIKSVNFMRKEFYNELYYVNNDNTAFFGLLHVANTYGFLEQIGYFYITRPKGSYYYRTDPKNMNLIFRSIFNNMKYFYIQSDNNTLEKKFLAYNYFESAMKSYKNFFSKITTGFEHFISVLDLYLNSSYFDNFQKKNLNHFKIKFIEMKKSIEQKNE